MNWRLLWSLFRDKIIKFIIAKLGLAVASPWVKPITFVMGLLMDKFIMPIYHQTIAKAVVVYRKSVEKKKLEEIDRAIALKKRDTVIDSIDSLK